MADAGGAAYGLRGRVATRDADRTVLDDRVVYVADGRIVAVADVGQPPAGFSGPVIDTGGIIHPGLIDLDHHMQYSAMPMWEVERTYRNVDQWMGSQIYRTSVSLPTSLLERSGDQRISGALSTYVRCKCLAGGTTTTGLPPTSRRPDLVRDIRRTKHPDLPPAHLRTAPPRAGEVEKLIKRFDDGSASLLHLADGVDDRARASFDLFELDGRWQIGESLAVVHGTGLDPARLEVLADHGASLVWTPVYDLLHYGETADVESARAVGVPLALATVGAPWGSRNLLTTLKVADILNADLEEPFEPSDLVDMVITNPARMLRWERSLGSLEAGRLADLIVVDGVDGDPDRRLLAATETDISLVIVDGVPRVGTPELMADLPVVGGEEYEIGGEQRVWHLVAADGTGSELPGLGESAEILADALERLPELEKMGGSKSPQGASPMTLDPLVVAGDRGYFDALERQLNVPDTVKAGLPGRYSVAPIRLLGGYESDDPLGDDQLGVITDVRMLCSVVASTHVEPPMSIGLFGTWGSGKSFFMQKMAERIREIEDSDDPHSCRSIRQIRFNAWHYMDSSLWASLAVEIFERIADPEPLTKRDIEARRSSELRASERRIEQRRQLRSQLEMYHEMRQGAEAALERSNAERERLANRLEVERARRMTAVEDLTAVKARKLITELNEDEEAQCLRNAAADALGVDHVAWSALAATANDLTSLGGQVAAVWRRLSADGRGRRTVVLAVAAAIAVLAGLIMLAVPSVQRAIGVVPLGAAVLFARKTAEQVEPAIRKVRGGLSFVQRAIDRADEVDAEFARANSVEAARLEIEIAALEHREAAIRAKLSALDEQVAATQRALDELDTGGRLYAFLEERAASSQYQQHLGLISLVRRDFTQLQTLLRMTRDDAALEDAIAPVDRIVLYVDDLDRCPPERVVEVLQAVHLLMAIPLFVVVVAVDPRWLLQSLRDQYRSILRPADALPGPPDDLTSTPQQYLEKIFQIPFTLPAMSDAGFAQLIRSLGPEAEPTEFERGSEPSFPAAAPAALVSTGSSADEPLVPASAPSPKRALIPVESGSIADGVLGGEDAGVELTRAEIEFAMRLGSLVDTPRAAKRMMNCYRMLRSTRYTGAASRFLGSSGSAGEHRVVLLLLAITSGYPDVYDDIATALERSGGIETWSDFVAMMEPVPDGSVATNAIVGPTHGLTARWRELHAALASMLDDLEMPDDLDAFRVWAPIVSRFSFSL